VNEWEEREIPAAIVFIVESFDTFIGRVTFAGAGGPDAKNGA
jgi:hypothetical protein